MDKKKVFCKNCKHREYTMEHGDSCLKFKFTTSSYLTSVERYAPCKVVNQKNDCRYYESMIDHVIITIKRFKKLFKGIE